MNKKNIIGNDNKIIFTLPNGEEIDYLELNNNKIDSSNINISGNNNKVILVAKSEEDILNILSNKGLFISIIGDNNLVKMGDVTFGFNEALGIKGLYLSIGGPAASWVDPNAVRYANDCKVIFGDNILVNGVRVYLQDSSSTVTVGDNSMFSWGIDVWCTDVHTITDLNGKPLNYGKSIEIGKHVWIGKDVKIGKNTKISDDSIIGWNSVVTKKFDEPNVIVAGNPAKIIKRDINWDARCLNCYEDYINLK